MRSSSDLQRLLIATRNSHKREEIGAMLGAAWELSDLNALPDFPDIDETGETFTENAIIKAEAVLDFFDGWVLADDSGLEVDALDGAPGVISARYAGKHGDDAANNRKLLAELERVGARGKARSARFRCVLVFAKRGQSPQIFEGAVEGIIGTAERGDRGFGYDPLFIPDGHCVSFAELSADTKNQISHRARAMAALKKAVT